VEARWSRRSSAALVAALAIAILVAGCGGGDRATLTKAELIERGDELCANAEAALAAGVHNYGHKVGFAHKLTGPNPKQERGLITEVVLPRFQALAEELGELDPPEDEAAKFEAIVEGLEEGVVEGEASPTTFRSGGNSFEEANEKATELGFEVCGDS
jgi:hypothetical protein